MDLRQSLYLLEDWHHVEQFMLNQGMCRIAIYGMGIVGEAFWERIRDTKIEVVYGIDKWKDTSCIEIKRPNEIGRDMDVIIVTVEPDFQNIRKELSEIIDVPIILLSSLLDEIMSIVLPIE